mgnify:CR=1 FL=1
MIFEKNMSAGYSKNELETVINAIKKDRKEGLLISGYDAMNVQIERIRRYLSVDYEKHPFDQVAAYNLAEKELYDEIAERYFKSNKS